MPSDGINPTGWYIASYITYYRRKGNQLVLTRTAKDYICILKIKIKIKIGYLQISELLEYNFF